MEDGRGAGHARRILRLYEMFFSLMFRFMDEYNVRDLGSLMIITTISIAETNEIDPDIDLISEETDIPYSTVRRKIEKMILDGWIEARKENQKLVFSISGSMKFAHPGQSDNEVNKKFNSDVVSIVMSAIRKVISDGEFEIQSENPKRLTD
ncbi:hypothetical protein H1W37_10640 [Stappia taiwanensis]|uniref:HTH iclR-type domain-containing protein n=1 Tax=Stappia taiwanensis TaxID=992267 RepID=A0A838XZ26_9HYPH|nr:hypothetical protein [Stappia taiwanensis]MBA4612113.1 hypothetical protein [Stappia taiwanensis]GGE90994.1 hypothetical protein GCM10007285_18230 [Stappia taiwanensis]